MRPLPFLVAALVFLPLAAASAYAAENVVNDPCSLAGVTDAACSAANITAPSDNAFIDTSTQRAVTVEGIAERDKRVYVYLVADKTLVNNVPYEAPTDESGHFTLDIPLGTLHDGKYGIVAYFLLSNAGGGNTGAFYQITDTPPSSFTIKSPPAPPVVHPPGPPPPAGTPPPTCPMLFFDTPSGKIGKFDSSDFLTRALGGPVEHTFFSVQAEGPGDALNPVAVRAYLFDKAFDKMRSAACEWATDPSNSKRVAVTDTAGVLAQLDEYLASTGYDDKTGGVLQVSLDTMREQVKQRIESDKCSQADIDDYYHNQQIGKDLIVFNNPGWIFLQDDVSTHVNGNIYGVNFTNGVGSFTCDGVKYTATYLTGASPVLFVSGNSSALAIRPDAVYAEPRGPWVVPANASVSPLYYEFAPRSLPLPATGWSVRGTDVARLLRSQLASWGYDDAEISAFLAKDVLPVLPEAPFVSVRILGTEEMNATVPLTVSPAAHVRRVFFALTPTAEQARLEAPDTRRFRLRAETGAVVREIGAAVVSP
jgi:hypothetical protein